MEIQSKTDKKRLSGMSDKDINLDDIPELDDKFFKDAYLQLLCEQIVTLHIEVREK